MSERNRIRCGLIAFGAVLLATVVALADTGTVKINDNAPRFNLQDETGRNVTIDQNLGKVIVLEWFDPTCEWTQRDYKAGRTKALAEKYKDKGVVWFAINSTRDSSISRNKTWIQQNQLPYSVLDDGRQTVAKQYGVQTVPMYFIIDKNGNVRYEGAIDDDESMTGAKRDGKMEWVDRALGELTSGKPVSYPDTHVYGCPVSGNK